MSIPGTAVTRRRLFVLAAASGTVLGAAWASGQNEAASPPPAQPEERISLSAFTEPVSLRALVEYFAGLLEVNIVADEALGGTVVLNAPIEIERRELLGFLASLLEQQGYSITPGAPGFLQIIPVANVDVDFDPDLGTTRLIPTLGVRPSSLKEMIDKQFEGSRQGRVSYLDDLGVIMVTNSPRRVALMADVITRVAESIREQEYIRFPLEYVAAPSARERVLELIGAPQTTGLGLPQQVDPQRPAGGTIRNLADRLAVDRQSNALVLRGRRDEAEEIRRIIAVLDVPNNLVARPYFTGSFTSAIAQIGEQLGLGKAEVIDSLGTQGGGTQQGRGLGENLNLGNFIAPGASTASTGGPRLIADVGRATILYFGTEKQHEQFTALVARFDTQQDVPIIRAYKLDHAKAEEVANLITSLITGQLQDTGGDLLGGSRSLFDQGRGRGSTLSPPPGVQAPQGEISLSQEDQSFVLADKENNQVLVKAPGKLQPQFEALIRSIDLRRPQVFIDVQIVAVTATDDFRLAFETQLINAGGTGGLVYTDFGLSNTPQGGGDARNPKTVGLGLGAITAAVIKSDYVPIIINALKRDVDARILSSPKLLVDDNTKASIATLEVQQTIVTSQGNATTERSLGEPVEAGTSLTVTPTIAEGGYVRLNYEIELSNFVGVGSDGIPPPTQKRNLASESTTVPASATIVIGGIVVDSRSDTIVKVPLLGDIPIIKHFFRDTRKNSSQTTLYVFITPRVLRNPTLNDYMLLTRGPLADAALPSTVPDMQPSRIEFIDARRGETEGDAEGGRSPGRSLDRRGDGR